MLNRNLLFGFVFLCLAALCAPAAAAQEFSFRTLYNFGRVMADEPPSLNGVDVEFPAEARKNGVQGTLIASVVLGEDGKTRDIKIVQSLPFGVDAAVTRALQTLYFKPARLQGKPVPVTMQIDFVVAAVYDEGDKNVAKPQILERPAPVYPAKYAAEKLKGKVSVQLLCRADGTIEVLGVNSTMPREFDRAAAEAAAKVRFQPAVHKKSKADVSQKMTIEYDFKP